MLTFLMLMNISGATPIAYVSNYNGNTVSVIDTVTNNITATITVGYIPQGIAATPDGKKVYVLDDADSYVDYIGTNTNEAVDKV